jgi:hypothetical protein
MIARRDPCPAAEGVMPLRTLPHIRGTTKVHHLQHNFQIIAIPLLSIVFYGQSQFQILKQIPHFTMATKGKFEPKTPVVLNPPKDDPITPEFLSKCNGKSTPTCVARLSIITRLWLIDEPRNRQQAVLCRDQGILFSPIRSSPLPLRPLHAPDLVHIRRG